MSRFSQKESILEEEIFYAILYKLISLRSNIKKKLISSMWLIGI